MNLSTYRAIMTPLDGSAFAEQALPLAIAVAAEKGAELHLVQIAEEIEVQAEAADGAVALQYPEALAERVVDETGIPVRAAVLPGRTVDGLRDYAEENGVDLVVIATHAPGGWDLLRHGSTTDSLIKELDLPFLTIRPMEGETDGAREVERLEHLLIALDGSEHAESVIGHALALGGSDQQVSLLQVVPAPLPNDPASVSFALSVDQETAETESAAALAYLDEVAEGISDHAAEVDTTVILDTRPVDAILEYADLNGVDLIAVATHGRGGIRRRGLGSVARDILRSSTVPVLVIRPA